MHVLDIINTNHTILKHPFMAATPEEVLGFVKPTPPCPSIFLNLPPTPHKQQPQHDHMALDSISRMLMEEDIVEKILCQYPENPILLQAQQPFAQILSAASGITSSNSQESSIVLSSALLPSQGRTMNLPNRDLASPSLNGTDSMVSPIEGSTGMQTLSTMAFLKGMEEARLFFPGGDNERLAHKKRFHEDGDARDNIVSRRRKQIMISVQTESEEQATARNLLDQLMLGLCSGAMQKLCVTTGEVIKQQNICVQVPHMNRGMKAMFVVDLETLLLRCAEAVGTNDRHNAGKLLEKIRGHSSPMGATTERLAHYLAEGLEARLAGTGSQLYRNLLMMKHSSVVELVKAYQLCMDATFSTKVAFVFSNKTIYNIAAGRSKLHIVHYGIEDGLQWTELFRWFAEREGGPPEVRITGINSLSQSATFHPAKRTEDAGRRLILCATKLGVPFKFRAITTKFETVRAEDLDIYPDEVLIVNSIFQFRTLMDETLVPDRINPRDQVLNNIRKMKPAVFIHGIVNASYCAASFVTRFREALYNFSAVFDLTEATIPRDNNLRLVVERDIFARFAMNIIACEGADRMERIQHYKDWHVRNQRAGLQQLPLDPDIIRVLKAQVKKHNQKHFMINEDDQWLLQGWKGRVLSALSIWAANDVTSSHSA